MPGGAEDAPSPKVNSSATAIPPGIKVSTGTWSRTSTTLLQPLWTAYVRIDPTRDSSCRSHADTKTLCPYVN
jgi:hypothetical protein